MGAKLDQLAMVSNLLVVASDLLATASDLLATASNLIATASNLIARAKLELRFLKPLKNFQGEFRASQALELFDGLQRECPDHVPSQCRP